MLFVNSGSKALTSITRLTEEQYERNCTIYKKLHEKYPGIHGTNSKYFSRFTSRPGYAHYMYEGQMTDALVDITPLELSMVCDGGFSYFGGSVTINPSGSFTVKIYID